MTPTGVTRAPGATDTTVPGASNLGAMIFLVDFPGLDAKDKARFAGAWEHLLAETEAFEVPRAAYMIDQTGRLRELSPLTLAHFQGYTETWMAPGAPSPPTDLMA